MERAAPYHDTAKASALSFNDIVASPWLEPRAHPAGLFARNNIGRREGERRAKAFQAPRQAGRSCYALPCRKKCARFQYPDGVREARNAAC